MKKNKIKIYDIDYLINEELTEEDLHNLFDTKSLKMSLIVNMFRESGENRDDYDIINICKTNQNWFKKYTWTKSQRESFFNKLCKVYKNVYQYGDYRSEQLADWWLIVYGLKVKKNNFFE